MLVGGIYVEVDEGGIGLLELFWRKGWGRFRGGGSSAFLMGWACVVRLVFFGLEGRGGYDGGILGGGWSKRVVLLGWVGFVLGGEENG